MSEHADEVRQIEAIKQLKARYFRLMDLRDWERWQDVLTPDCTMTLAGDPPTVLAGRAAIVASAERHLGTRVGMHLGHMPEIELTGPASAAGAWSLLACSAPIPGAGEPPPTAMMSFGRYEDVYRLEADGSWRIAETRLFTVLRVLDAIPEGAVLGPSDGVVIVRP